MKIKENEIRRFLKNGNGFDFEIFDSVDSTNAFLKTKASDGAREGTVAIAETQTAGKGRMGRTFSSPADSGIYISVLLRPTDRAFNGVLITTCAAVAVSEAIEKVTGIKTDIKWVNDLYFKGKKVSGILAEGSLDGSSSRFEYAILGIGVNIIDTFGGTELDGIATGLYNTATYGFICDIRHRLTAEILNSFFSYYSRGLTDCKAELLSKYRERLFIIGKRVQVLSYTDLRDATVVSLNDDFSLKVAYDDGTLAALNSGEVRLKIK